MLFRSSLEQISRYKVNSDYTYNNIKQQSGFAAELVKEARDNQARIVNNDAQRTRTTDGIGRTNDQRHDHLLLDEKQKVITGSESQMKFKGGYSTPEEIRMSSERIVKDMVREKWEKYNDRPMDIPTEQVQHAKQFAREEAAKLKAQAEKFRESGNLEKAELLASKAERFEVAEKNIRDSGVSSREAMEARLNPKLFVAKEIAEVSHNAGVEAAKGAFLLSGAISSAQNVFSVIYEGKPLEEAAKDVVLTTAQSSVMAYGVGATGTAIKSMMHTSTNSVTRALGKSNAPAMIATAIVEVSKSLHRYAKGDINEEELLEELGEKGTGMVAASYGAAVGSAVFPGIGTVIGGMIGYTLSSLLYKDSLSILKDSRLSTQRRAVIETLNSEAVKAIRHYQEEIRVQSRREHARREVLFEELLDTIHHSIITNDLNSLFKNINALGKEFKMHLQFANFEEFDEFMSNEDETLIL